MLRKTLPGNGQAEDKRDAMGLAPGHDLGPGVVAVPAQRDPGLRPVQPDAPDQAPDMACDLLAGGCFRGAQDESDGPSGRGLIDVDRGMTALAVKPVPEGELLLAVGGIERVIDVQRDCVRRRVLAGAVDIHHLAGQPDQRADIRSVFPA